mgnify:CR=1 FL=1
MKHIGWMSMVESESEKVVKNHMGDVEGPFHEHKNHNF